MTTCLRQIGPRSCLAVLGALWLAATTGSVRVTAQDVGTEAQRESGKKLYLQNCSQCHGEKGDGQGYATPHLFPQPRNFTLGKFKVRTTPNGALPTHQDLVNVIRRGMPYTSMPAPLPKNQKQFEEFFKGDGLVQTTALRDALMNYHRLLEKEGKLSEVSAAPATEKKLGAGGGQ